MSMEMADLFSSKSRFKVLKLLIQCAEPIPLRTISNLAGLPIRSVVLALEALLKLKIVCDSRFKSSRLFQMNKSHPFYEELKNIFSQIEKSEIKIRSRAYDGDGTLALEFMQSANRFFLGRR